MASVGCLRSVDDKNRNLEKENLEEENMRTAVKQPVPSGAIRPSETAGTADAQV
jgi:hypothetical protein